MPRLAPLHPRDRRPRRLLYLCPLILLLLWVGLPMSRAAQLLLTHPTYAAPTPPADLPVQAIHFNARDGAPLSGWLARRDAHAPTIVLVAGFKSDRTRMLPYARFLYAAGYNVLLYDARGTGQSGGSFSLGLREVDDARGAIAYLQSRHDLPVHRYGLLGVSLGAGVVIAAAARTPSVLATVADSSYVNQRPVVERLNALQLGPLRLPLAPIAPWTIDHLLGAPLADFSPIKDVARIAPRALLLIHSRHDRDPTTPLSGALELYHAAGQPVSLWIAPRGGHSEAYDAQPNTYRQRVLAFLRRYLAVSH